MIKYEFVEKYIKAKFGAAENIVIKPLRGVESIKEYGYGSPIYVQFELGGETKRYVINTVRPDRFGHDYKSDRASILIWSYDAFNKLPNHVRAVDVGYVSKDGSLNSIAEFDEFFLVTEFVEGRLYFEDLERLKESEATDEDVRKVDALASYLAKIHTFDIGGVDRELYTRRIRDLVGHGECFMGLVDSYGWAPQKVVDEEWLKKIEHMMIDWRWKLKPKKHRLRIIHGDFHPWNILWANDTFYLLDRSRGEYGDPADDVAALTINYIFFSLQKFEELKDPFKKLMIRFYDKYLELTGDRELLEVVQPFYAWRGLVIVSPIWYPSLPIEVRRKVFKFVENVLSSEVFDYKNAEKYLV